MNSLRSRMERGWSRNQNKWRSTFWNGDGCFLERSRAPPVHVFDFAIVAEWRIMVVDLRMRSLTPLRLVLNQFNVPRAFFDPNAPSETALHSKYLTRRAIAIRPWPIYAGTHKYNKPPEGKKTSGVDSAGIDYRYIANRKMLFGMFIVEAGSMFRTRNCTGITWCRLVGWVQWERCNGT